MIKTAEPLITLDNAGYEQGKNWLVRGVDMTIQPGEIVTLVGPNGSGKSTTAKLALGILNPIEGTAKRKANLRIGYVPQKINIDWTLPISVHRFMHLTIKLKDDEIADALKQTGVGHLIRNEVRNLSGGELQRVLLARAIARKPDLLVLDEPVQGVDFTGAIALYELINQIRNSIKCGVLLISHDLHLVMAATDRVICLNGHVCCQGTPSSVTQSPEYHHLFGTNAAQTLAIYHHDHDHTHLPDGSVRHSDGSITDHCHPDDGHHHEHGQHKEHQDAG